MQFIVDESTGVAVVEYLRSQGYDVLAVAETMLQANDADILDRAAREGRTLITNDKDFGELVFRGGQPHHGVILLRLQDESSVNRVRMVQIVLEKYADRLTGHFIVVTERGIRLRPTAGAP
jgi:predicted nuclease of predicted toxin-antitoxin system